MTRVLLSVALTALVAGGLAAAPRQAATFFSGALGVRVDVLVTERGVPVAGLTADDFEVRDNGVPQRVRLAMVLDTPVNAVLVQRCHNDDFRFTRLAEELRANTAPQRGC